MKLKKKLILTLGVFISLVTCADLFAAKSVEVNLGFIDPSFGVVSSPGGGKTSVYIGFAPIVSFYLTDNLKFYTAYGFTLNTPMWHDIGIGIGYEFNPEGKMSFETYTLLKAGYSFYLTSVDSLVYSGEIHCRINLKVDEKYRLFAGTGLAFSYFDSIENPAFLDYKAMITRIPFEAGISFTY